jgi:hypothetical protein
MASPAPVRKDNIAAHWKCLAACTLMSMCPFQYGVDFGIIGGLQAMKGFLEACFFSHISSSAVLIVFRFSGLQI